MPLVIKTATMLLRVSYFVSVISCLLDLEAQLAVARALLVNLLILNTQMVKTRLRYGCLEGRTKCILGFP